jgi:putative hydrolase of the HAD superfamily
MPVEASRIQAVLFDLGGTLVDTRDFQGWSTIWSGLGLPTDAEALAHAWEEVHAAGTEPTNSPEDLWADVLDRSTGRVPKSGLVRRGLEIRSSRPLQGVVFSDVQRCLDRLRGERRRLGVVSNSRSEEAVRDLLDRLGLLASFELVVSSGTEKVAKPAPEIYRRAVARIGLLPRAILFVGDDVENDVLGPKTSGLHSVWLNRFGTGFGDDPPEINSLSEVPRVLHELELSGLVK